MPKVLITPEALIDCDGPHIDLLKDAGVEFAFPKRREKGDAAHCFASLFVPFNAGADK